MKPDPPTRAPGEGLDLRALLRQNEGRNYDLHAAHVNPANVRTLKTIGFDRCYVRATGPYLWDIQGTKYLDMLSGYGVFAFGRNHPEIRRVLTEFLQLEYPCPLRDFKTEERLFELRESYYAATSPTRS